jgi:hypothetical protein
MTNTFINQLKQKHLKEQEQTQKRKEVSNRIHELASKGNSYNWGVINAIFENVSLVVLILFQRDVILFSI